MSISIGEVPVTINASVTDTLDTREVDLGYINHIVNDGPSDLELTLNNDTLRLYAGEIIEDVDINIFKIAFRTYAAIDTASIRILGKKGSNTGSTPIAFENVAGSVESSLIVQISNIFFLSNDGAETIRFSVDESVATSQRVFELGSGNVLDNLPLPVHTLYFEADANTNFRLLGRRRA